MPSARSQPGPGEQGSGPTQLDEVNVTARCEFENRFNSTGARVTIGRRDIEVMGANTIGDILRQTPGLQVTTTANGGLEVRMRGMGAENTRVMIDGVAVSTSNRTSQLPLDELPTDLIERVEVIRAPTAEFQGAVGGTLNIVLRAASAKRETYIWLSDQYVWGHNAAQMFFRRPARSVRPRLANPPRKTLRPVVGVILVHSRQALAILAVIPRVSPLQATPRQAQSTMWINCVYAIRFGLCCRELMAALVLATR